MSRTTASMSILVCLLICSHCVLMFPAKTIVTSTGASFSHEHPFAQPIDDEDSRSNTDVEEISQEIIIGVNTESEINCERIRSLILSKKGEVKGTILKQGKTYAFVADIPQGALPSLKWKLLNKGLAEYVEPNLKLRLSALPNDPEWRLNWGLTKIKADHAWNTTKGEKSVVIAFVDTGIDWNHPDLAGNIWNNTNEIIDGEDNDGNGFVDDLRGWDFVDTSDPVYSGEDGTQRDNNPMDFHGHGTHCAGIAAAVGNNNIGVSGVTWNCQIMPVRAGYKGDDGGGYLELDDAAAAIIYAADQGAHIISCSWGEYYGSQLIKKAVEHAYDAGALLVASAGNEFTDQKLYPAAYPEVMAISATDERDFRAIFSNFGYWIDLAAPGTNIYSTAYDDSYYRMTGTSMAAPFVAGAAALVWSNSPELSHNLVREQLRLTSDDLGEIGFDSYFGYGRVNAEEAVELEQSTHDLTVFEMCITSPFVIGKPLLVDVTLLNAGISEERDVEVQFLANSSLINSEVLVGLDSGATEEVSFLWDTSQYLQGHYNLTVHIVPVQNENRTVNNCLTREVFIRCPRILEVPRDFTSIQEAIYEAFEGDTISVSAGTYHENVIIYKDHLKLIGEDASTTIISGDYFRSRGDVLLVRGVNHVEISNFTLRNSQRSSNREPPFSGLMIQYSKHVKATNLIAESNRGGIFLYCSDNVTLKQNHMRGNNFNFGLDGSEPSHFIHSIDQSNSLEDKPLWYLVEVSNTAVPPEVGCVILVNSTSIKLQNLDLARNHAGIMCIATSNISISKSAFLSNYIGIYVKDCNSVNISAANMTLNHRGIVVEHSENIIMENNFISGNSVSKEGINLHHSTRCQARSNVMQRNSINLYLQDSSENTVINNEISSAWNRGILLKNAHYNLVSENKLFNNIGNFMSDGFALDINTSSNNNIYHNNFISNTHNVISTDSINIFDNGYPSAGNYWDDFNGTDFHKGPFQNETGIDGISDIPYLLDTNCTDMYPLTVPFGPMTKKGEYISVFATDTLHLIFESVTVEGFSTLNLTKTGPTPPLNFKLLGNYYNLKTTANYSGKISIRIIYNALQTDQEDCMQLMQWNETKQGWMNITLQIDEQNDVIYGETDNLNIFAIYVPTVIDIAIDSLSSPKTIIGKGYTLKIELNIINKGEYTESSNVTIYSNGRIIDTYMDVVLTSGNLTYVTIEWDTTGYTKGNYTLAAYVWPISGEIEIEDNSFTDGWIIIAMVGDVTSLEDPSLPDGKVDMIDVGAVAARFGTETGKQPPPSKQSYEPNYDVICDGKIDIRDIASVATHYGEVDL